eukprot:CAMPEP_0174733140 /NCGR_PEP_ID=MMETSP1094-20130205/60731_1 /TAXON_ID=156173 /ORGANISM="Chrysochromulina brevifilum, Strain UTEX LB 985" /LENGTH=359 /DNA_ID=CAMNT_0015935761 /DNA_START=35 /DNA_END=1114 /DNA_ORIENTATION=+
MEESTVICRVCLEAESGDDQLVQPCACSGTQANVHLSCLRRWQQSSSNVSRRSICPVCKAAYLPAYQPKPREPERGPLSWLIDDRLARFVGLFGLLVTCLCCSHSGVSLTVGFIAISLMIARGNLLQTLIGFRICLIVQEDGVPLLRLVRVGSAIPGLTAGALLVATDCVTHGVFARSVIFLTRHDDYGTIGYILNRPTDAIRHFHSGAPLQHALAVPEAPRCVQHGVGGPVDLDSWAILHSFDELPASTPLEGAPPGSLVRVGGDLSLLRERARAGAAVHRARGSAAPVLVKAVHGHASWAVGQLESEIRANLWVWAPGVGHHFALCSSEAATSYATWQRAFTAVGVAQAAAANNVAA